MMLRSFASLVLLASLVLTACSDDEPAPAQGSSSGKPAAGPVVVGGVTIPSDAKLCTQKLTAAGSTTVVSFSWSDVPSATKYAVRAFKSAAGATTEDTVFEGLQTEKAYTFPDRVSGAFYRIEVFAVQDTTVLCQLDGVNGVTAK